MSYILDALKKAEKERQRGTVPNLSTNQHTPPGKKKRSLWPYIIVFVLVVSVGVVFFWLGTRKSKETTVVARTTVKQTPESQTMALSELPDSQAHTIKESSQPEEKDSSEDKVSSVEKISPVVNVSPEQKLSPGEKESEKEILTDSELIEKPQNLPKTTSQKQVTPLHKEENEKSSVVDTGESSGPSSSEVRESPKPEAPDDSSPAASADTVLTNRIYTFQTLPASVKESLPPIHISIFIYSDDPDSRIVKINGQSVKEGQVLADELIVEEIVPDGVIFSYEAYRFHVGIK